jgi:hypothetical protein
MCVDGKATGPRWHSPSYVPTLYTTWPNLIADASNGVLGDPCVKFMWHVLAIHLQWVQAFLGIADWFMPR